MFLSAKNGVKFHARTLIELMMTKKQFYNALSQLKGAGLVEKYGDTYFHTTFGSIVYLQDIMELSNCQSRIKEMRIIDSLRHVKDISQSDIDKFSAQILGKLQKDNNKEKNKEDVKTVADTTWPIMEFFSGYEQMITGLARFIAASNEEILIATRVSIDNIIKQLIDKAKQGVKIRVLADLKLVGGYLKMHGTRHTLDTKRTSEIEKERFKVITNPWYPYDKENNIDRRVTKVPFGMIIFDRKAVGIELVDSYKPREFTAGLLISDLRTATRMKDVYQKMSDEAVNLEDSTDIVVK